MVAISNILLFVAAATASVLPRDAATIKTDLQKINTDTQSLTAAANKYNGGGIANAAPVQSAYNTVDKDINSANTDAQNSAAVSDTDAQSIIDYINNTLEPSVSAAVTAINNKKSQFTTDGLKPTVLKDFQTLKNDTTTLGNSLKAKASSAKQSAAQAALTKVLNDLQKGVTAYSS